MKSSNFREWDLNQIEVCFNIKQIDHLLTLENWLSFKYEINQYERQYLEQLRYQFISFGGDDWNEVELENKLISPLIIFSNIDNKNFCYFLERELKTQIGEHELTGRVDGLIASGFRAPKLPFFCLHEYKRGTDPNGDPRGQTLIAMLVAQKLNHENNIINKPIFGCYVIGRSWYFMVLQGNEYAISSDYSCANQDSLFQIFIALKSLRNQIETLFF